MAVMIQPNQAGTLYLAMGEPSNTSLALHGMTIPAMVEPRKVMAITTVASRARVWKLKILKAYRYEMIAAGMTMSSNALRGVFVRGSILETHSGSIRSMAAAKMTRVELRKSVPDQPTHHRLIRSTMMNISNGLLTINAANRAGYGQIGNGGGLEVYPQVEF